MESCQRKRSKGRWDDLLSLLGDTKLPYNKAVNSVRRPIFRKRKHLCNAGAFLNIMQTKEDLLVCSTPPNIKDVKKNKKRITMFACVYDCLKTGRFENHKIT